MPLRAIARLIQTMLYAQRFFPYYVYNILGGIEEDGKSALPLFYAESASPHFSWYCPIPRIASDNCLRVLPPCLSQ